MNLWKGIALIYGKSWVNNHAHVPGQDPGSTSVTPNGLRTGRPHIYHWDNTKR